MEEGNWLFQLALKLNGIGLAEKEKWLLIQNQIAFSLVEKKYGKLLWLLIPIDISGKSESTSGSSH